MTVHGFSLTRCMSPTAWSGTMTKVSSLSHATKARRQLSGSFSMKVSCLRFSFCSFNSRRCCKKERARYLLSLEGNYQPCGVGTGQNKIQQGQIIRVVFYFLTTSITWMNRNGDSEDPCRTSAVAGNGRHVPATMRNNRFSCLYAVDRVPSIEGHDFAVQTSYMAFYSSQ